MNNALVIGLLALAFATSGFAAPNSGASYASPGATASVRLKLNPAPDVLFNRHGPSLIRVTSPFGKTLELKLPKGAPYPPDAQNYDQSVPIITLKIPIPKTAKAGAYTVNLETELYLCDAVQHICYRTTPTIQTVIYVGQTGQDRDAILELMRPGKPGI